MTPRQRLEEILNKCLNDSGAIHEYKTQEALDQIEALYAPVVEALKAIEQYTGMTYFVPEDLRSNNWKWLDYCNRTAKQALSALEQKESDS